MPHPHQRGQSSVELVALLPAVVLVLLLAWQLAATAHAWLTTAGAARAGARAALVGAPARAAALASLPRGLAEGAGVEAGEATVRVRVRAPRPLPFVPSLDALVLEATAPVVRSAP